MARSIRGGHQVRCYRTQRGGGGKERDVKASSPKLNVLGVGEGDEYAFLGGVDTIFGEELVGGSLLGRG